jgi:hypothetical protein
MSVKVALRVLSTYALMGKVKIEEVIAATMPPSTITITSSIKLYPDSRCSLISK